MLVYTALLKSLCTVYYCISFCSQRASVSTSGAAAAATEAVTAFDVYDRRRSRIDMLLSAERRSAGRERRGVEGGREGGRGFDQLMGHEHVGRVQSLLLQ